MFERECADRYGNTLGAENNATVPGYGSARSARSEDKANCPLHMEENRSRLDSGEMMRCSSHFSVYFLSSTALWVGVKR